MKCLESSVIKWTSTILASARRGIYDRALTYFLQMRRVGVEPNETTLSITIKVCGQAVKPGFGICLHCLLVKNGFSNHLFVASALVTMYSNFDHTVAARKQFDEMHERDSVLWNSMIAGYSQNGFNKEACNLFNNMIKNYIDWKMCVNSYTIASVMKACSGLASSFTGLCLHGYAIKLGFVTDLFVSGAIIDMYSKFGYIDMARIVFDQIGERDVVVWNTIITGYAHNYFSKEAIDLFRQMQCEGFLPNETTYASLLKASTLIGDSSIGICFHAKTLKLGSSSNVYVGTALVDMYSKFLEMENAEKAFEDMNKRNLVSFNALVTGYSLIGSHERTFRAYLDLRTEGMKPDSYTFIGLFSSCSVFAALVEGIQVHSHSIMFGLDLDTSVGNSLVNFYSKCGLTDHALKAFESINTPNSISWSGIVSALAQNGEGERALQNYCQMHKSFGKTDEFSSSSVLKAVSNWASDNQGKHLHAHMIKFGLECNIFVGSSLVDMYSKCGMARDAYIVFSIMPTKNVVSWNSMIMGYAQNGFCKEALVLFNKMINNEILPTCVTFIGVLSACCHAGLVEEGRKYYELMVHNYGILPSIEHCTCMVDLFGRAGYLNEAECFIHNSPFSEEASVWGSLISSCGLHKNSDVGFRAAKQSLCLDPCSSPVYANISNLYASEELWSEVEKTRDLMRAVGVEKDPGCSLIEL